MADGAFFPRDPAATDVYLRLDYSAASATVTGYYATEPDNWQTARTVGNVPAFKLVGLGASNAPGPGGVTSDLLAHFDYLEMAQP